MDHSLWDSALDEIMNTWDRHMNPEKYYQSAVDHPVWDHGSAESKIPEVVKAQGTQVYPDHRGSRDLLGGASRNYNMIEYERLARKRGNWAIPDPSPEDQRTGFTLDKMPTLGDLLNSQTKKNASY